MTEVRRIGSISEAEFAPLVRAVAGEDADTSEGFARAAWTCVAEPGDRDAGALIAALGAVDALRLVIARTDADDIVAQLSERDDLDTDPDRWVEAQKRWGPRADLSASLLALRQAGRFGMRLLVPGDDAWPTQVDDLQDHAPLALWVRGDVARLHALDRSYW